MSQKAAANEAFVRALQARLGVKVDGWAGKDTGEALEAALARPVADGGVSDAPDPNDALLIKELERDEGRVLHAYQDSLGYWTIGVGRLIDKRKGGGISNEEADYLKRNDIARFKRELDRVAPWWRDLDPVRQRAMLNLTFNMGPGWISDFSNTVAKLRAGDYAGAASGILASAYARQVGDRAKRIAHMIRTGTAAPL